VKAAIEGAQKLATAVIETARTAIVGIIKVVGQALIAIGDVLLAAFPEMRDRFRNAMKAVVKTAEAAVNALAKTLKKGVQTALNLLGKGLDAALGLLEKGMKAAVDIAKTAVSGAIKLADAAIKAVGAFAVLVKDIAGNPGQWLSNLGAGAMDGIKNHFWGAFQTGVKEWFSQKVEEVLGLGMTIWNVLAKGGIKTAEVGQMAWEGIKSAIPGVLIQILIEKVVSMIVPAAGTVLLIIEGLQAAWGTASRVLQAFDRFMVFLKAVKTGQAGPPFGSALAAAGVVLIDFVSNWLLKRLRGPASKVAGKIREIAAKIGKKIKKALKKVKRKLGKVKDKFFGKKGGKGDNNKGRGREEQRKRKVQERFEKGLAALEKYQAKYRGKTTSSLLFKAGLALIRMRYGFTKLELTQQGNRWVIDAVMNPRKVVSVDHGTILNVNALNPLNPPDAKPPLKKEFATSARGNTRYYCTDNEKNRWYWRPKGNSPTEGTWIKAHDNENKKKAEAAARQYLQTNKPKFISLVADDKDLTAGSFDAGGLDPGTKEEQEERLFIGEAKHAGGKHPERVKYIPPNLLNTQQPSGHFRSNPLSATTDNLIENIGKMQRRAQELGGLALVQRVDTALQAGRVTLIYFLAGQARITKPTLEKVKERIYNELRSLLKNRYQMTPEQIEQVINQVEVTTQNISI
jgi:hypothetical protein